MTPIATIFVLLLVAVLAFGFGMMAGAYEEKRHIQRRHPHAYQEVREEDEEGDMKWFWR